MLTPEEVTQLVTIAQAILRRKPHGNPVTKQVGPFEVAVNDIGTDSYEHGVSLTWVDGKNAMEIKLKAIGPWGTISVWPEPPSKEK